MCTVSIFPSDKNSNSFVFTFNRDEAVERQNLPPDWYNVNRCEMIFPKDEVAGGTWLGVSEHKRLVGIMNGEFKAHKRQPPYRKSRGVVVKEFLAAEDLKEFTDNYHFDGIEPFTMLVVEWAPELVIQEIVWDAKMLHNKIVPPKPQIWSSSPLYNTGIKQKRLDWFNTFKDENKISAEAIWEFHHKAGEGNKEIDLVMDRGFLKTQSISQIYISSDHGSFIYKQLVDGAVITKNLERLI